MAKLTDDTGQRLHYDTKENIYEYIIRVYDLEEVDQ